MESIIALLVSTSFAFASCRAMAMNPEIPPARDLVEISFPILSSRRLAVLDLKTTADSMIFPNEHETLWRTLSSAVPLIGVSVLAYCLARRIDPLSAKGFNSIPLHRWLLVIIFIDSWAFIFGGGVLITGVGLSLNITSCSAAIFLCICLYAVSKFLIYWFLVEKVHMVHPHVSHTRYGSPVYRICIGFVIGYGVIIALALAGRISYIRNGHPPLRTDHIAYGTDGACVIGLGRIASLSLLIYDLALNVFFTCMFLYPIYRSHNLSSRLRLIAKRTLIAATVSLLTSALNVFILTLFHGQELGWICLGSCGIDVIVNAIAIYSVTAPIYDHHEPTNDAPSSPQKASSNRGVFAGIRRVLPRSLSKRPSVPDCNPGEATWTRGILEVEDGNRPAGESRSNPTRSVHFSPDSTLATRLDRTLCTTLGVVTEMELEAGENGKGKGVEGKLQSPQPHPALQNGRRVRPNSLSSPIMVSRYGHTVAVGEQMEQLDSLSYASMGYLAPSDYPSPGTPEDTTLEVRKEFNKRTWDPTLRSSKTDKSNANANPNANSKSNSPSESTSNVTITPNTNANTSSSSIPNSNSNRPRSGSLSSSEAATPLPPPSSTANMVHMPHAKRKRLSLTTSESHDTILLNSNNFTATPSATPTSTRFPTRSLTAASPFSNLNNFNPSDPSNSGSSSPISSNSNSNSTNPANASSSNYVSKPSTFAQRLSPSPNESSSSLGTGTPRMRSPSTALSIPADPDPEEIRGRMSVLAAVTEATSTAKPSKAAKIVSLTGIAMGKSASNGGRKRSNTDSDTMGPMLEVSIKMETTRKVEQRIVNANSNSNGKSRWREGRDGRGKSRESSLILDDYHGSTYNRGRSHSSSGGL